MLLLSTTLNYLFYDMVYEDSLYRTLCLIVTSICEELRHVLQTDGKIFFKVLLTNEILFYIELCLNKELVWEHLACELMILKLFFQNHVR